VELDFYLKLNWISEKWKGKTDDEFQDDETRFDDDWWEPGVEVVNGIELNKLIEKEEAFWIEFPEDGVLAYTQRFIGTVFSMMELHDFPFDRQIIPITFESFHWKADDMILLRLEQHGHQTPPLPGKDWKTMSPEVKLLEWSVEAINVLEKLNYYSFEDRTYSQVCVEVVITRDSGYYLRQVISMVILIVIMSWSIFFMPGAGLPERTGITVTLFLAAIAFNFVVGGSLPRISYNTKLDTFLLSSYLIIASTLMQNVFAYWAELFLGEGASFIFDVVSLLSFAGFYGTFSYYFITAAIKKQQKVLGPRAGSVLLRKDAKAAALGGDFNFNLK